MSDGAREVAMTDVIAVLTEDHRRMRRVFEEFESLPATAHLARSKVAARMIDLITTHAFVSREVLYPRISALLPDHEDDIVSWRAAHRQADEVAVQLWTMRPEDERFSDRAAALIGHLRHQLVSQEERWFPRLVAALEPAALERIGTELLRARRQAPTSPRLDP
ncbi:MAG: hemerythrin domain-containing protein [Marmoricola sp.]